MSTSPPLLPRLPVPHLRHTLDRYLTSIQPLLLEAERRGGDSYDNAYAMREKWANEFESGIGKVLQDRLLALDRVSPHNWLDDNFWMNKAYLEWRAPLLINSNWWLAFHDDNMIPKEALSAEPSYPRARITYWQVRRAAWLIYRMLEFRQRLDVNGLHPETTRTGIWLRENAAKMFNKARVPKTFCDIISTFAPSTSPHALDILVTIHNWCYTVNVYHPPEISSSVPALVTVHELESRLFGIISDVEERLGRGERAFPIGILSADHRDRWTENLEHLLSLSPQNQASYQALLSSVMGLSLDHTTHVIEPTSSEHPRSEAQAAIDSHLHSIRSTVDNVANRFFDKPFTLVVDPATRAGASGEHSVCDALVPSIVAEYGIAEGLDPTSHCEKPNTTGWTRLEWTTDDRLWQECEAATTRARQLISDSDDSVFWFTHYGADWIKDFAKFSPDAYIQMALQLAWYKTRGEFTATYETVLTRMFRRGRTETLRALTTESRVWVMSMIDPCSSLSEQYAKLCCAIQKHIRLTREAATGRGIDRHLLGLKMMFRPEDGPFPRLFEDQIFTESQKWKLSTSGLSAGHLFKGTGFGAVYPDGYGVNYLAGSNMIKFGIESKFSSNLTSTKCFIDAITSSLKTMYMLCSSQVVDSRSTVTHL